jgi:hypothetical protein
MSPRALLTCALLCSFSAASRSDTPVNQISPDHLALTTSSPPPALNYVQKLDPGQFFRVSVKNSCSEYSFKKTPLVEPPKVKLLSKARPAVKLSDLPGPDEIDCVLRDLRSDDVTYDGTVAGYILSLSAKNKKDPITALKVTGMTFPADADAVQIEKDVVKKFNETRDNLKKTPPDACKSKKDSDLEACLDDAAMAQVGKPATLHDLTMVVAFSAPPPINIDFAGAFTVSFLTDPVYSLHGPSGTPPSYTIVESNEARDRVRPGIAAMVHTSLPGFLSGIPVFTFGLGVNNNSQVDYFFGLGVRAYGQFYLTVGLDVGQRSRLPNGIGMTSTVTDVNALSNLPKKTTGALFFGVSYAFLSSSKDAFMKPFKPVEPNPTPPK